MTSEIRSTTTLDKLAQRRDELRLQLHLARAEARDEWEHLEEKWHHLHRTLEPVEEASVETMRELAAVARLLMEEIGDGYGRIRDAIRQRCAS